MKNADKKQPDTISGLKTGLKRHYNIQNAFTGSNAQTSSMVELSRSVLKMVEMGYHGQAKILPKFRCSLLPNCRVNFLDSQITRAVWMLQRAHERVPLLADLSKHVTPRPLETVTTYRGVVVDTMGLGKTYLALLFISFVAVYGPLTESNTMHKPILILMPGGMVLSQWAQVIYKNFPDLNMILAHGKKPTEHKYAELWVSGAAMKKAPACFKLWPPHLQYVFDRKDPKASKTIILLLYDTFASRTLT